MTHFTLFLQVRDFADALGCTSLVTACEKFEQKFFTHVAEGEEYLALNADQVYALVSHDELHVASEEPVFNAVLAWVKHDLAARKEHLPRLLTCVRLALLTPQFLSDTVAAEKSVRSSHQCRYGKCTHDFIFLCS